MNCPCCNTEMERGFLSVDDTGLIPLVYLSEVDSQKRGLRDRLTRNPTVLLINRADKIEAYHCVRCKKIIAVLDEA